MSNITKDCLTCYYNSLGSIKKGLCTVHAEGKTITKAKHTPGPGIINTENDITTNDGANIICNVDTGLVVHTHNASLIAAAPEMLEALEIALIRLEQLDTPTCSNAHTIGQVFSAITKARGEK